MANTSSAKKAIRVATRKSLINRKTTATFKAAKKEVQDLINKGKIDEAKKALPTAYKKIDKAAKTNTIHKNTAARMKSRLSAKINKALEK